MIVGAISDIGLRRENNQDYMFASDEKDFPLFIVADGMGGHKAGDIASKMAVEIVVAHFRNNKGKLFKEDDINNQIVKAIEDANHKIYIKSLEMPEYKGMGTTITLGYICGSKVLIGHVGDSRAYFIRDKKISQITEDHSLVNELIKNGSISKEEAINHPQKNMITRAVGTSSEIAIDLFFINYQTDDCLLLCSDGLFNMVDEKTILDVVTIDDNKDIYRVCNTMVTLAKQNGGVDNITVIGIKFDNEVLI